jgi:hypothetical protein
VAKSGGGSGETVKALAASPKRGEKRRRKWQQASASENRKPAGEENKAGISGDENAV